MLGGCEARLSYSLSDTIVAAKERELTVPSLGRFLRDEPTVHPSRLEESSGDGQSERKRGSFVL